jgi:hypothetical protein
MTMNPGFIPTYDAIQEVITFMVEPLQKNTADVLAVVLMSFCQMFGHPPCRNFENKRTSRTRKQAIPLMMPSCNVISSIVTLTCVG